ncbi:unnamed protein product [Heligmosomoides polygyrus]|uniref:Reverse transcriptase domain-containing protein n=1 Tax=Heligmosomoides polygyrus TaxID=6339 RepID=A0A183GA97_HELPZ|nr:unnamed protein product [Heligmosomoides polygyrus]
MSVPPRGATGNCPLLRAEPNMDIRVQATGRPMEVPCHITWLMVLHVSRDNATDSAIADKLAKPGEYKRGSLMRGQHGGTALVQRSRNPGKTRVATLNWKTFDRVPREVIVYALRQHNVSEELIEWVRLLYFCPRRRVQTPATPASIEFPIFVGAHQGSALSLLLFIVIVDAISRALQRPVPWRLLYAHDVMLACEDTIELQRQVQAKCDRLESFGLKQNVKNTEYLTTDKDESSSIKVNGIELPRTSVFKYLGPAITSDGGLLVEANSRVSVA